MKVELSTGKTSEAFSYKGAYNAIYGARSFGTKMFSRYLIVQSISRRRRQISAISCIVMIMRQEKVKRFQTIIYQTIM